MIYPIIGKGRSGTSLISKCANIFGVNVGSYTHKQHWAHDGENAKGMWEDSDFTGLDDPILFAFDGAWDNPPNFPEGWEKSEKIKHLREKAVEMVRKKTENNENWGWKDPRTAIILKFWLDIIPKEQTKIIHCVRNPLSVHGSLNKRNKFTLEKSIGLWSWYNTNIMNLTSDYERILIRYEDMIADADKEFCRLSNFINGRDPNQKELEEYAEFSESRLNHNENSDEDFYNHPEISPEIKNQYRELVNG